MNLQVWEQLDEALSHLENNSKIRGVVIQSGLTDRPVFTAGNDLMELYAPKTSQERYTEFWKFRYLFTLI